MQISKLKIISLFLLPLASSSIGHCTIDKKEKKPKTKQTRQTIRKKEKSIYYQICKHKKPILALGALVVAAALVYYQRSKNSKKLLQYVKAKDWEQANTLLRDSWFIDPNYKDESGYTALSLAAENGHTEIVQALIDQGADLNIQNEDGNTALIRAAINGHTETAKLLIDQGADLNIQNNLGKTAQSIATENGHKAIVTLLKTQAPSRDSK